MTIKNKKLGKIDVYFLVLILFLSLRPISIFFNIKNDTLLFVVVIMTLITTVLSVISLPFILFFQIKNKNKTIFQKIILAMSILFTGFILYDGYLLYRSEQNKPYAIAQWGELDDFEEYLRYNDIEDINKTDSSGNTLLIRAVFNTDSQILSKLIEMGADVNYKTSYNLTALEVASSLRRYPMAEILLKAGANPNYNNGGATALTLSVTKDGGDTKMLQILVNGGGDVNNRFYENMTLLMVALRGDASIETVKMLLELGNDIKARDDYGYNALTHYIINSDNVEVLKYLIENGADVNNITDKGNSVLDIAYQDNKSDEIKEILIKAGARRNND